MSAREFCILTQVIDQPVVRYSSNLLYCIVFAQVMDMLAAFSLCVKWEW